MLGRDSQHHANVLFPADRCKNAATVNPGYLCPSKQDQATFKEVVRLDLVNST